MNKVISLILLLLFTCFTNTAMAQDNSLKGDHSFKILAGMTGLGVSYEVNPLKNSFFELGASSTYGISRIGIEGKYALINRENFKLKAGLDASLFATISGGYVLVNQRFPTSTVMPHVSIENKEIGLKCSVLTYTNSSGNRSYFPILTLALNVSHSKKKDLNIY